MQQGIQRTGREVPCPNCGGPIEFKMGAAAALVCPWCRFGVVRRGVALDAIGKVADLVPTAPVAGVEARGTLKGERFVVGGRLQLDHGRGPWDEWYIEFPDRRRWGWLAFAQGVWYVTFPVEGAQGMPPWEAMSPGQRGRLQGTGEVEWTVGERGESVVLSAEGELPFPPPPSGTRGRYVDLHGPGGAFATIDYGDGSEPPRLFAGERVSPAEVRFEQGAGPSPVERSRGERLRCPSCGGPVDVRVPHDTQRAVCPSCNGLLDYRQGGLHYLEQLEQARAHALIPLGTRGSLRGLDCLCIGMMERSVAIDGEEYGWQEYLLHTPHGYRWLLQDNGHWLWVEPLGVADPVQAGSRVRLGGTTYRGFQSAESRVRFVVGEFYWQVKLGDTSWVEDYIAPPQVVSYERNDREETWSLGTYLEPETVWHAFGLQGRPPPRSGVHPVQPNPVRRRTAAAVSLFTALLLVLLAVVAGAVASEPRVLVAAGPIADGPGNLPLPPLQDPDMVQLAEQRAQRVGASPPRSLTARRTDARYAAVSVTPPFEVRSEDAGLLVTLRCVRVGRAWVGASVALVRIPAGTTREFTLEVDRWSSSSPLDSGVERMELVGIPSGRYRLRVEARWAASPDRTITTQPSASLQLESFPLARSGGGSVIFFVLLAFVPFVHAMMRHAAFEQKRWANASFFSSGAGGAGALAAGVAGLWGASSCGSDCSGCGSDCGGCGD